MIFAPIWRGFAAIAGRPDRRPPPLLLRPQRPAHGDARSSRRRAVSEWWRWPSPRYFAWPKPAPAASTGPRALSRVTFEDGLQAQPTWSPDGRFIAYTSDQAGNFDIWVQPIAGGRAVQVTTDPATDWQPSWSADGNTLAFRSERDGGGIFVVPALGGRERRLTTFGYWPEWSPKKSELLFVVRPPLQNASGVLPPVYLAGLDGAPPRQILADVIGKFLSVGRISVASRRTANLVPRHDGNGVWILDSAAFGRRARPVQRSPTVCRGR